jgi:peptidyl-prolyl cis-trans isomerase SurA
MLFCIQRLSRLLPVLGLAACLGSFPATAQVALAKPRDFIVAVVDSVPVTNHEVTLRAQRLQQELTRDGKPVPNNLLQTALERLITEKALLEHAREFGIETDAAAVDQAEQRLAAQQQLTLDALHRKLRAEGSSPERLRRELREQLTLQRLAERNVPSRIRISDAEIDAEVQARIKASPDLNPDIHLAHILIAVPERASVEQVAVLEQRAQDLLERLRKGADFAVLAKEASDGSERNRGGLMGMRPLDRYPTLFAQAVRDLPEGQLAPLLRSGAGFHILKVVERRSNNAVTITETRVRHILLRPGGQLSLAAARARVTEYKRQIETGKADFATLAREHSQDASGADGGELGWISPGVFVPEFEEVMNRLQPGQLSDPVVSRFGVHLIEVMARRQSPIKDRDLREMVRNSLREKKYPEAYEAWAQEVRGRAYVEYRDPPQ